MGVVSKAVVRRIWWPSEQSFKWSVWRSHRRAEPYWFNSWADAIEVATDGGFAGDLIRRTETSAGWDEREALDM